MYVADLLRRKLGASWKSDDPQIDRNVNTTNVCIANCKFCNFTGYPGMKKRILPTLIHIRRRSKKPLEYGGDQLLLQVAITPTRA